MRRITFALLLVLLAFGAVFVTNASAGCNRIKGVQQPCYCGEIVTVNVCQVFGARICLAFCTPVTCCGGTQEFQAACDMGRCTFASVALPESQRPRIIYMANCSGDFEAVRIGPVATPSQAR